MFNKHVWVRGAAFPLTQLSLLERRACPLPQRGEGTATIAATRASLMHGVTTSSAAAPSPSPPAPAPAPAVRSCPHPLPAPSARGAFGRDSPPSIRAPSRRVQNPKLRTTALPRPRRRGSAPPAPSGSRDPNSRDSYRPCAWPSSAPPAAIGLADRRACPAAPSATRR